MIFCVKDDKDDVVQFLKDNGFYLGDHDCFDNATIFVSGGKYKGSLSVACLEVIDELMLDYMNGLSETQVIISCSINIQSIEIDVVKDVIKENKRLIVAIESNLKIEKIYKKGNDFSDDNYNQDKES